LPLKSFVSLLIFIVAALFGSALGAEDLNVYFKISPRIELLRPFADPIDLSLLITGADGRPVKQGSVAIRLDAPAPGRFFSTDFPLVEGTLLNEMQLSLRQGRANWKYLFPIRGEYRLAVDVVADDGRKASKTFSFKVRENQEKWLALCAFSAALFILGFAAGRIFTGTRERTVSLIAMALLSGFAPSLNAQPGGAAGPAGLEIEPVTVGKPSILRWSSANGGDANPTGFLTLTITHLEKQKIVFAVEKVPVAREWSMKFHFPDGAEYRVVAFAQVPGEEPIRYQQLVSVTGVEPPMKAMVPVLSYFLAVIVLGLGAGRWSKRRAGSQ
jgi:hypothetical protein